MNAKEEALLAEAKEILEKNWEDSYTVPSPDLYPHQWNWDSAFVALGYSRYNRDRAEKELLSIFEGQCDNGMLPHIVFRRKSDYFPGPDYWETDLSENSPSIKTSAITQPPVHAIAALQVYENSIEGEKVESFLEKIFPKILDFHNYLFEERDPEKLGLVTIFHPWESGFDNSTRWDEALARIEVQNLPEYVRTDTNKIDSDQRPKKESYDKYIYLVELMKRQNYKEELFYDEFPFKIKDVVFSSILYDANECLLKMAEILGEDDSMIRGWMRRTEDNYLEYFCIDKEREVLAYDFDLITNRSV
ncbi:MAG: glycoside hydrolase, partial [Halobacteriota archaeon]|nr:glycoside hydrolase [Halobacteriota archaeon]